MTITTCPSCGTQTGSGIACQSCGTPVPADAAASETPSGYASYWQGMLSRLQRLAAPKYQVTGILGYGGMAGVFGADEPRLGRKVAIKVMSPALMMDPKLVERFVQEARTIALLDHPNIVTIYEVDEREDLHWFTMSYVPGRTLGQVMTETVAPLDVGVVRAWLYQIGDALAYAHHNGVVHRDIKPGNVLLDLRGNAHVTDFGIAKVADGEAGLTRTGMLVGTPAYMSPEQCSSGEVGGASDQYSLGAMAYQMLTGQPPFTGPTLAVLQAHVTAPPRPIQELRPECPPALAEAVHRMLAKRPEDRWPGISAAITGAGAAPVAMDDPVRRELELLAAHTATLTLSPEVEALREGSRLPLTVTVQDAAGRDIRNRRIVWKTSAPVVAGVSDDAVLALSPGSARIEAVCGPARAALSITVEPDPILDIEVTPRELELPRGGVSSFEVAVLDLDGSRLDERAVLWSTSDPAIARVNVHGAVKGVSSGQAVIAARTGGKYTTASVTVTPVDAPSTEHDAAARPMTAPGTPSHPATVGSSAAPATAAGATTSSTAASLAGSTPTPSTGEITAWATASRTQPGAQTPGSGERAATVPGADTRSGADASGPPLSAVSAAPASEQQARGDMLRRRMPVVAAAVVLLLAATAMLVPWSRGAAPAPDPTEADAGDPSQQQEPYAAGAAPADAAATDVAGAGDQPEPESAAPAGAAEEQPAAAPATGSLAVADNLPAGSRVAVRAANGRTWTLSRAPLSLDPGSYAVEFSAPGYEADRRTVVIRAGEAQRWSPALRRAEQPAAPQPAPEAAPDTPVVPVPAAEPPAAPPTRASTPARDPAADRSAVQGAVNDFVAAMSRRDRGVLPLLVANRRSGWEALFEHSREFSATLGGMEPVQLDEDSATVRFTVNVAFRNQNGTGSSATAFTGTARRSGSGWRLVSVSH